MTLTGIGPIGLIFRSVPLSLLLLGKRKARVDESLLRNQICKPHLKICAGKHHRGFYPGSIPRCYSQFSLFNLYLFTLPVQSISPSGLFSLEWTIILEAKPLSSNLILGLLRVPHFLWWNNFTLVFLDGFVSSTIAVVPHSQPPTAKENYLTSLLLGPEILSAG